MRKLGIYVQGRETRYEKASSTARLFLVGVGVHQGSFLSPLLFITVLEALPKEFRTGCPLELLYADELMIRAESMQELLGKMNTLKCRNGEEWPAYELEKDKKFWYLTSIWVHRINLEWIAVVSCRHVGSNAIFSGGCLCW